MRNFGNNNNRSRGPRGGRDYDRRNSGGGRGFDRRDSGRKQMHDAVCADCGDNCKVPFMPSSGKPVFCSNCFEDRGNGNGNSGRDSRRPSFSNRGGSSPRNSRPQPQKNYDRQFELVNDKLDKILETLSPTETVSPVIETPDPIIETPAPTEEVDEVSDETSVEDQE